MSLNLVRLSKHDRNFELNHNSKFARNLRLWLPFNYLAGGLHVRDRSVYRYDALRESGTTTWKATRRGWGLNFAGGRLNVSDNPFDVDDRTTWTMWSWLSQVSGSDTYVLMASEDTSTTGRVIWYSSRNASSGAQRLYHQSGSPDTEVVVGNTAVDDDADHFLCLVRNGSAWTMYLDGKVDGTGTNTPGVINAPNYMYIGERGGGDELRGTMYEFGWADRAWTAGEVAEYYRQTVGGGLSELAMAVMRHYPVASVAPGAFTGKSTIIGGHVF